MLTVVSSGLQGSIGPTGTAFYTVTLANPYDVPIEELDVALTVAGVNSICPISSTQMSVSNIQVAYPHNSNNQVPPGGEAFVQAQITTDNAPVTCQASKSVTLPMFIVPTITVTFQLVGNPPTFTANLSQFMIGGSSS